MSLHRLFRCALVPVLLLSASLAAAPARAAVYVYNCILSPLQSIPTSLGSRGTGGGRFVIDTDANTMTFRIVHTGLTAPELFAHIHGDGTSVPGAGANSPIVKVLPSGNPKVGVWTYLQSQEAMILSGRCYVNVHTNTFPAGEIRGQIVPLVASLDGEQETPAVTSRGRGFAAFSIDTLSNLLTYYVKTDSLSSAETAAHIHGTSLHGVASGVLFTLPAGAVKSGTWNYPQLNEEALLSGRMYVNVHTSTQPGGEIRGQIVANVVPMDALQEVPAGTATTSSGWATVSLDTATATLGYDVHIDRLSSTEVQAHLHGYAPAGTNAGVVQSVGVGARKVGTWTYGAENAGNLYNGLIYLNSHTTNFPGGEIRGQIDRLPVARAVLGVGDRPRVTGLLSASPNPTLGNTALSFELARESAVSLQVVGVDGRSVRAWPALPFAPGRHTLDWDGRDDAGHAVAPGVYFVTLHTAEGTRTTRLARLR